MDSVLVVSPSEKSANFLVESLNSISCNKVTVTNSCSESRRLLLERDFDLCIINSPLLDESGEKLAKDIATNFTSQVLLLVKMDFYDDISAEVEDFGIATVGKPINKNLFWTTLKLLKASYNRVQKMQIENTKLNQRIQDIKIVDRAKCILISNEYLSEEQAHKYIEKTAMDKRVSKREVAEDILKKFNQI